MVDFAKLVSSLIGGGIARTLHETFSRIDCQVSHVELRPSQLKEIEALDQCLVRQDVVVKLPTGGGGNYNWTGLSEASDGSRGKSWRIPCSDSAVGGAGH